MQAIWWRPPNLTAWHRGAPLQASLERVKRLGQRPALPRLPPVLRHGHHGPAASASRVVCPPPDGAGRHALQLHQSSSQMPGYLGGMCSAGNAASGKARCRASRDSPSCAPGSRTHLRLMAGFQMGQYPPLRPPQSALHPRLAGCAPGAPYHALPWRSHAAPGGAPLQAR